MSVKTDRLASSRWAPGFLIGLGCLVCFNLLAARNVILFIGDGMGYGHLKLGQEYLGRAFCFEGYSHGQSITVLPDGSATDSSTAATALATGYQHPNNDTISSDLSGAPITTILELGRDAGLKTGIVTTDDIGGATPSSFGAHEPSRNNLTDLRYDYLRADTTSGQEHPASLPDVLLGGGSSAGSGYTATAVGAGYAWVDTAGELAAYAGTSRLLGLFASTTMTREYDRPGNSTEPQLADMVAKALERVHPNDNHGFFLIIESALIDKISHDATVDRKLYLQRELAEFDRAVGVAQSWVSTHPEENTLILVTADHETGVSLGANGGWYYSGTSHTAANVPLYASQEVGIGGRTLDNTETFVVMRDFLFSPSAPPSPPTGLTATAGNTQVELRWTAPVGATSYAVKRSTVSGMDYTPVATPSAASYTDTGLENGTTYYYVVAAVNAAGTGGDSAEVSATPRVPPPPPPTGLMATAGNAQVVLTWTASAGATSYTVNRAVGNSSGPYSAIAGGVPAPTYTDTAVANGTTYYYTVQAVNSNGSSDVSAYAGATPQGPPLAPANLTAVTGKKTGQIVLSWSASAGATSYTVKRATSSGGPYTTIKSKLATRTYTDSRLTSGATYYYVVTATNSKGESPPSPVASARAK